MDVNRVRRGEMIAAASAIALLLIMFIFSWFGFADAPSGSDFDGRNAWGSFSVIDLILFITIVAAIGAALMSANSQSVNLPVALSVVVAALGILSVLLILFRIIFPPDFGIGDLANSLGADSGADVPDNGRKIGVFLGLLAAAGIAYGGYEAMRDEGTSFKGEADRMQNRDRTSGPGGTSAGNPPPPPPPSTGTGTGPGSTGPGSTEAGGPPPRV